MIGAASRWQSLDMRPAEVRRMGHHTLYCYEKPSGLRCRCRGTTRIKDQAGKRRVHPAPRSRSPCDP